MDYSTKNIVITIMYIIIYNALRNIQKPAKDQESLKINHNGSH